MLLVAAVFGQTAGFEFLNFDDDQYLDAQVRRGLTWRGLWSCFTRGHVGNWHPLTTLSFMLDAEWFGGWAGGYHLHNVVLHAATAAVLFVALSRLTGAMERSVVATAIFAVHPLRAESVAWITERKDVLSGLFLALTLWSYAEYARRRTPLHYLAVVGAFTAGLMSKSMLVTLPVGLLILDRWPLRRLARPGEDTVGGARSWRELVAGKVPAARPVAGLLAEHDRLRGRGGASHRNAAFRRPRGVERGGLHVVRSAVVRAGGACAALSLFVDRTRGLASRRVHAVRARGQRVGLADAAAVAEFGHGLAVVPHLPAAGDRLHSRRHPVDRRPLHLHLADLARGGDGVGAV